MASGSGNNRASGVEHTAECAVRCCQQLCHAHESTAAVDTKIERFGTSSCATPRAKALGDPRSSAPRTAPSTRRQHKKRKSTHATRKEQKQELERIIRGLETRLDTLKLSALGGQGGWPENALLRRVVEDQHLILARAQALISAAPHKVLNFVHPTEMTIRLGADPTQRFETLESLQQPKLRLARRFLLARSCGLAPASAYRTEERYESPCGDWFTTQLDVTPLRGIQGGVVAVLSALQQVIFNAEVALFEALGALTVREVASLGGDPFCHARLRTTMPRGLVVESNSEHVSELVDGEAVLATDYVNEDALYPYRPQQRVRRDTTDVLRVYVHEDGGERVVVLTRWRCSCIRRSALAVSRQELQELHDTDARMADAILDCLRQQLALPTLL